MARILIADDDAHIARVLSMWLGRHGHRVTIVSNGEAAMNLLADEPFDLVISDMNMPLLDGIGLVRALRTDLKQDIPVVVLTARCDQEDLHRELASHGAKVFSKPFLPSQLVVEINALLGVVSL